MRYQLGIMNNTRAITTTKLNGSAKGDERSRTDLISPLKTEALVGRKVLFWKVTGDALVVDHASLNAVLDLEAKGREVAQWQKRGANMALQLSPVDVFIAESGTPMDFPKQYKFKISK